MSKTEDEGLIKALKDRVKELEDMLGIVYPDGLGMRHNTKASVFEDIFSIPENLIRLYRSLHPEDKVSTEKDILDVTLDNVLTNAPYNDLGFRVGERLLILVEAQATWSDLIILRVLMYLAQTYYNYINEKGINLYGSLGDTQLPEPELYVIYTGDRKGRPKKLSFRKNFFKGRKVALEVEVKILYGGKDDIIGQYVSFTKVLDTQVKIYGKTAKAVEETIRICIERNILKDYLESHKGEVLDIMKRLFEQQTVFNQYVEAEKKKSEEEGRTEGEGNILRLIDYLNNNGRISEILKITNDENLRKQLLSEMESSNRQIQEAAVG